MLLPPSLLRRTIISTAGCNRGPIFREYSKHGLVAISRQGAGREFSHRLLVTNTKENKNVINNKRPSIGHDTSMLSMNEQSTPTPSQTSTSSPSTEAAAASAGDILDASFADKIHSKVKTESGGHSGMFPWRSSSELHERLVPGTPENYSKGMLLGGNLTSANARMDGFATAVFFLRIPFWDMVLFRNATEQDLADSMAWAFGAAVQQITAGGMMDSEETKTENKNDTEGQLALPTLKDMLEERKLAKLFESATEFGSKSLQVKLETKPILYSEGGLAAEVDRSNASGIATAINDIPASLRDGPKIVSLFVFPFLSREQSQNGDPHHLRKYSRLLDAISASNDENTEAADSSYANSLELSRDLMEDFRKKGVSENTIVCQVLIPCLETFWVMDTKTGKILQGDANERLVLHLVRFEQTTKTHIVPNSDKTNDSLSSRFFPFRHELGEWKITDIDDLCEGNLLL